MRIALVHWNRDEAAERAARLVAMGFKVDSGWRDGAKALREIRAAPPAAIVIDLTRLPSHGREAALALRQSKATRAIPLVFVDGEPAKVERIKAALPDATFTTWGKLARALAAAIARPPRDPVVPSRRDTGYSGTPLPKKLGIKPGATVALIDAPQGFEQRLGELPDGARLVRKTGAAADLGLLFADSCKALQQRLAKVLAAFPDDGLWIAWPKKASGYETDLNDNVVRATGLANGLVDFKVCAIDATWSGLKFAKRRD